MGEGGKRCECGLLLGGSCEKPAFCDDEASCGAGNTGKGGIP